LFVHTIRAAIATFRSQPPPDDDDDDWDWNDEEAPAKSTLELASTSTTRGMSSSLLVIDSTTHTQKLTQRGSRHSDVPTPPPPAARAQKLGVPMGFKAAGSPKILRPVAKVAPPQRPIPLPVKKDDDFFAEVGLSSIKSAAPLPTEELGQDDWGDDADLDDLLDD
jgi:hypothetical protein